MTVCGALWYTFGLADFAVAMLLGSKYQLYLFIYCFLIISFCLLVTCLVSKRGINPLKLGFASIIPLLHPKYFINSQSAAYTFLGVSCFIQYFPVVY